MSTLGAFRVFKQQNYLQNLSAPGAIGDLDVGDIIENLF